MGARRQNNENDRLRCGHSPALVKMLRTAADRISGLYYRRGIALTCSIASFGKTGHPGYEEQGRMESYE